MEYKGSSVYDDEQFFKRFHSRRNRNDSPNNVIEKPLFLELLGDVSEKRIVDLGCGDAQFGRELLEQGCEFYEGVEGSQNMVKEATANLKGMNASIYFRSMEEWKFEPNTYDVVVSRVAFHYIADLHPVFKGIWEGLKEDGKFVFSVQHPILLSSQKSAQMSGQKNDWIVDDYFVIGERVEPWLDKKVVKYHRTVEDYFHLLKTNGFIVEDMREGRPQREHFDEKSEYLRRMRIPLFLLFSCKKKR